MNPTNGSDDRGPALDRDAFFCPHCDTFAHQRWMPLYRKIGGIYQEAKEGRTLIRMLDSTVPSYSGTWSTSQCVACKEFATWRSDRMVYPATGVVGAASADMPPAAAELYEEAREVVAVSRRAGAALARATLERLLKELDTDAPRNENLASRIERITPRVSSSLGDLLTLVRHVGNKSLHVDEVPDEAVVLILNEGDTEMVEVIFASINDLVDELVTKPARAARIAASVPEAVRRRATGAVV